MGHEKPAELPTKSATYKQCKERSTNSYYCNYSKFLLKCVKDSKEGAMDTSIAQTQDDSSGETVPLFQLEIMTADIEKSLDTSGSRKSVTLTLTARRSNDELLQFISLFKKKLNQIKSCG